jgi:hypothetical protein
MALMNACLTWMVCQTSLPHSIAITNIHTFISWFNIFFSTCLCFLFIFFHFNQCSFPFLSFLPHLSFPQAFSYSSFYSIQFLFLISLFVWCVSFLYSLPHFNFVFVISFIYFCCKYYVCCFHCCRSTLFFIVNFLRGFLLLTFQFASLLK